MNVHLNKSHISTSHRLNLPPRNVRQQRGKQKQHPSIIVRFSNRDKQNELYKKKSLLETNPIIKSTFGNSHVSLNENLSSHRKMLLSAAKLAKHKLNFRYLWASQGRIRLRREAESRVVNIHSDT